MKITWIDPKDLKPEFIFHIHKNGKIGVRADMQRYLKLAPNKSISLGSNVSDIEDKSIYGIINDEVLDTAFTIRKSGRYLFIAIHHLLHYLKIPYKDGLTYFTMKEITVDKNQF